jgi:hypothetical protein
MDDDTRLSILCYAELAPSVHNTQPWSFVVHDDVIEVRADRSRQLSMLDPAGRELSISCGVAVEFAYLATRAMGFGCEVRLRPNDDPDLLATLEIGGRELSDPDTRALVDAIPRRYTDRGPYDAVPVPIDLPLRWEKGVREHGGFLEVLDREGDRLAVIQALSAGEAAQAADPGFRAELARWVRAEPAPDGVPLRALPDPAVTQVVTDVPLRHFAAEQADVHPGDSAEPPQVERDMLLLLGSDGDDVVDWLQAGRALGWLLLSLTVDGLSAQPLGQALDIEATRVRLERELGMVTRIQLLLRVGRGHGRPTTGRRDAELATSGPGRIR